ncbi:MAG: type I restriction endonuclease subunit R [Pseudonocardia sp.]|nr:type I restriction endonuclease subunit R [Pseudonocardia sp.]
MLAAGWLRGDPSGYDRALGLDTGELFAFVGATQVDEWQRLMVAYGTDDPNDAQRRFAARLAAEIDARGALDVLRHGVRDRGVTIRVAYFRPAHALADDALTLYRGNRLTVTRQLHYSATTPDHSLDLALFVNGVPVATAELKNQLTSQTVEHSKAQYRRDRDPRELLFDRRALVHFAVDQDLVFLTTRLAGERTRFLPFNTGSAGPGVSGGAGNPPAGPGRYRTSYLWEQVWQPDAWLDLLRRFVHVEKPARRARVHDQPVIFPRFHQWHAVREMTAHAAEHGAGRNYLVMHSAGSGKSNTIAWLVHRLSSLHSADDRPVFDKVVVITDRDVLDRQLQDTIYQFDHVTGVVTKITDRQGAKSTQVADALADETTKILIVTVQTFPYVLDRAAVTPGRRYAVVVDEAHSSQSGESAAAVKRALLHAGLGDVDDDGDLLTASALARGRHDSLSYFAFTATPKAKTIELFGTPEKSTGTLGPFHTYSMRQAIDEGFILDVLRNYVTYQTYWKLANANPDDPEVDPRKASAQLARYAMLHPTSMTQRAELIVDHFHSRVAGRLGGRAKAMVVTRSREHAVRLYRAIVDYAATRGYTDCAALVAFSGELEVDGISYTEPAVTGMPERELPEAFAHTRADDPGGTKDDYRILVVAEKYQTGFDQPLLTTMYVDKKLDGVAAVQTLSRLNRTHPRKSQDDVFVLDLANDAENIQAAFAPYYETAITEPTDPNVLYTAERAVLDHAVLVESEMRSFAQAYLAAQRMARDDARWARAHGELYRLTDPARDRFVELREREPDAAEDFRGALRDFVRLYGFLSQVVSFVDEGLERLYVYGKHLLNRLPKREDPGVDIGQVDLTHLRISRTGEHDVSLSPEGEQVLPGFTGDGAGRQAAPPDRVSLSDLIKDFNDRFGTSLGEADLVRPMEQAAEDPRVQAAALVNTEVDFAHVFDDVFEEKVIERVESNTAFLKAFSDDEDFKSKFTRAARSRAYEMIRRDVA